MESLINDTLNKYDFEMIKIIGNGSYGKVYLSIEKQTKRPYAIKIQQKHLLFLPDINFNILKLISGRNKDNKPNLKNNSFALINNFFQDSKFIYFVLDYVPGGELFTLMRKEIKFPPVNARFYIAQIIDALDTLHRNKIIYRDLKPENLLIDSDGYLKFVDFGVAKQIENKTKTLAGTPTYMAPEIVKQEEYSFEIKKGLILFPKNMDKKLKNFIQHLLIGDPKKRMGSFIGDNQKEKENENIMNTNNNTPGKKEIKKINIYEHIFLKNYPWKELKNKEIKN